MTREEIQKNQQDELERNLWAAAGDLRKKMEADEYKDYLLGLIFYKYLSENLVKYVEEKYLVEDKISYSSAWKKSEYKEKLKSTLVADSNLGYYIEAEYLWSELILKIKNGKFDISILSKAINSISDSTLGNESESDFEGLFEDMDLNSSKLGKGESERTKTISSVMLKIDDIDFKYDDAEIDVLGNAYEYLISNFAASAGKKAGEFYTPQQVSRILAKIVTYQKSKLQSVYDPTCGSGSLLLRVGYEIPVTSYYGQESKSTTYNLARMNMLLHGISFKHFDIKNDDTLEKPRHIDMKFDAIVANPPYSANWSSDSKFIEDERFSSYGKLAPKSKADYAFIQHMIYQLSDNGTMAVVLPHGVLSRGGSEALIREYLIKEKNYLDAIIGLPANIFYGTNIPTCILVFKKCRTHDDNILIIDASKEFESGRNQNILRDCDVDKIISSYIDRREIEKYSHLASLDEVAYNDYVLSIPRYIDTFIPSSPVNVKAIYDNAERVLSNKEIAIKNVETGLEELGVFDLENIISKLFTGQIRFKRNDGSSYPEWVEKKFVKLTDFETSKSIEPLDEGKYIIMDMGTVDSSGKKLLHKKTNTCKFLLKKGDLVMPKDDIGAGLIICKTAYIDKDDTFVLGDHIYRLSFNSENSLFMHYFINSELIQKELHRYVTGSAIKGVVASSFKNITFKLPSIEEQTRIADFLKNVDNVISASEEELNIWFTIKRGLLQ